MIDQSTQTQDQQSSTLEGAFSHARVDQFQRRPASSWSANSAIYRALSTHGGFDLEVSFSTENGSEFGDPFVEVSFPSGNYLLQVVFQIELSELIIRFVEGRNVVNHVRCPLDFHLFPLWRLWISIGKDGKVEVYFLDFVIAELDMKLQSIGAYWVNTNTCVSPTFRPTNLRGYLTETGSSGSTTVIYSLGSVPLVEPPNFFTADQKPCAYNYTIKYIAKCPVIYATVDATASAFFDIVTSVSKARLYNLRHLPTLDLKSGHIVLDVPGAVEATKLYWSDEMEEGRADFRTVISDLCPTANPTESRKSCFLSFSEAFRLLPPSGAEVRLALRGPGFEPPLFHIRLSPETWRAMAKLFPVPPFGDWKPTVGLSCLIVDLCHLLYSSDNAQTCMKFAPQLVSVLTECTNIVGERLPVPNALSRTSEQLVSWEGPSEHECKIWQFQHDIVSAVESVNTSGDILEEVIDNLIYGIREPERNWAILAVADFAIRHKFEHCIAKWSNDDFIWRVLNKPEQTWEYSTLSALLASKGEFGTCVVILENLAGRVEQRDLARVNISAIAAAFRLFIRARFSHDFRELFLRPMMRLVGNFNSEEHTQFRNVDLQAAFLEYFELSRYDPHWLQDEYHNFIDTQYGSVPEFWGHNTETTSVMKMSPQRRRMQVSRDNATKLGDYFSRLGDHRPGEDSEIPKLFGRSYRTRYLRSVDMLHTGSGRLVGSELLDARGWPIRQRALPQGISFPETAILPDVNEVAEAIHHLIGCPRHRHFRLLADIGRAVAADGLTGYEDLLERVSAGEFESDYASEAVLLDVLVWASQRGEGKHEPAFARMAPSKTKHAPPGSIEPAGYLSAAKRIAGRSSIISSINAGRLDDPGTAVNAQAEATLAGSFFSDTIVAVVTCHANLLTHLPACRESWVKDVQAMGVRVRFFVGAVEGAVSTTDELPSDLVVLPVGDSYEDLPDKVLSMYHWLQANEEFSFVLKIDDDCYLDATNFLTSLSYRRVHYYGRPLFALPTTFNRRWHQGRANRAVNQRAIDTSPLGSKYADGGGCYTLSREAVAALLAIAQTDLGLQLRAASFFEDKLVGDLLKIAGFELGSEGYSSAQKRVNRSNGIPVLQIDRSFYPSAVSGIAMAHLNGSEEMLPIHRSRESNLLLPPRLFPLDRDVSLDYLSNMLEVIGAGVDSSRLAHARIVCVSVIRNELKLLPHFLNHYRKLGVQYFLIVDNLSDDGSREYLCAQSDVAVFSAASDYSGSHYGVVWQRTLLDHFCIGRWVVVADADELLVTDGEQCLSLPEQCDALERSNFDAAIVVMVDMYPQGDLRNADFARSDLIAAAPCFDRKPVSKWPYNRGPFGNLESFVSSLRHRIIPLSAPHMFTSQKVALFKYNSLMSFSEGFHFGSGMRWSPQPLAFLHFKYSSDFVDKANKEVLRGQHFGGALEYRLYLKMAQEGSLDFWQSGVSQVFSWGDWRPLFTLLGDLKV
ncbi:glycosyltransferase family 2 protein [Stagnihabitans tardus]|uniref:Galactosyltransferase n=1 Tax=Stagnihabitans tardus TaxID=2699202 RepID=A0AAE5BVX2_9RHOB|nr:glycosyltransferase family 2 protein [Stagnihabitans tardus]NBZ89421.1 hypothetical protein [Stagnihabitans tardus]